MLSFLWSFYKKHKTTLTSISGLAIFLIGIIWTYDVQQLTPTGALTHQEIFQIRSFLTLVSISLYLLTLLLFTLHYYKKDVDDLSRTDLTEEDKTNIRNLLTCPKCGTSRLQSIVDPATSSFISKFGVYWDSGHNMYCLSCMKPLKNSSIGYSYFFCSDPKCNSKHILKDNNGDLISKQQAIDLMTKK